MTAASRALVVRVALVLAHRGHRQGRTEAVHQKLEGQVVLLSQEAQRRGGLRRQPNRRIALGQRPLNHGPVAYGGVELLRGQERESSLSHRPVHVDAPLREIRHQGGVAGRMRVDDLLAALQTALHPRRDAVLPVWLVAIEQQHVEVPLGAGTRTSWIPRTTTKRPLSSAVLAPGERSSDGDVLDLGLDLRRGDELDDQHRGRAPSRRRPASGRSATRRRAAPRRTPRTPAPCS